MLKCVRQKNVFLTAPSALFFPDGRAEKSARPTSSEHGKKGGHVLHQLWHNDDDDLEAKSQGGDGVQRLWPLLQVARGKSPRHHAEGHNTHAQT